MNPHPGIIRLREKIAKYERDREVHKALRRQEQLAAPGNTKETGDICDYFQIFPFFLP